MNKISFQNQIDEIIKENFPHLKQLKNLLQPTLIFNLGEKIETENTKLNELNFLGKINFSEIKEIWEEKIPNGDLLFYLKKSIDHYPITKNDYKVIFHKNGNTESSRIVEFNIDISKSYTIPSYQENIILDSNINEQYREELEEIITETNSQINNYEYDFAHQIFGNPQAIQGTVKFHWALNYLGFPLKSDYSEFELNKIKQEEENLILLLQLNLSDPKIEFEVFGDSVLYFGIHKTDFENENFENIILEVQNT